MLYVRSATSFSSHKLLPSDDQEAEYLATLNTAEFECFSLESFGSLQEFKTTYENILYRNIENGHVT